MLYDDLVRTRLKPQVDDQRDGLTRRPGRRLEPQFRPRLPLGGLQVGIELAGLAESSLLDFVFTVCDSAAGEVCPLWPGQPISAHWGVEDPAAAGGDDKARRKAFFRAYSRLQQRIQLFLSLPLARLDRVALTQRLKEIGDS